MNHRINGLFKNICSPCVHSSWNDYRQVFLRHSANLIFHASKGTEIERIEMQPRFSPIIFKMRIEDEGVRHHHQNSPLVLYKKTSRAFLCISTTLSFSRWSFAHYFFLYILFFFFCFFWAKVSRARKKQFWAFTVKVSEQSKVRTLIFAKRLSNLWAKL